MTTKQLSPVLPYRTLNNTILPVAATSNPPSFNSKSSLPANDMQWRFIQSFGDDASSDDDLVTALQYDPTGEYLAVGDKAGRICLFESGSTTPIEYKFYTEFQSHEKDYDTLKSTPIEEKINAIAWAQRTPNGLNMLAANDNVIKLWKVTDKKIKRTKNASTVQNGVITIPQLTASQTITNALLKRTYSNAHGSYHIHSLSVCSDGQTFLSADDLRVHVWSIESNATAFNVIDTKPDRLDELTEVITSATFHPSHCHLLLYASSKGSLKLCDMRQRALHDTFSQQFEVEEDASRRSFFSEIINSISLCAFAGSDGGLLIARDYLTVKVWDVRQDSRPMLTFPIHDYLKQHLVDLFSNDFIFDKFTASASYDGTRIVSGSYNNHIVIHNTNTGQTVQMEAQKDPLGRGEKFAPDVSQMDFAKKALYVSYHPSMDVVAVAGLNKVYIYQELTESLKTLT